jgi:lipopolysaccharide transport system ATP-binding protein
MTARARLEEIRLIQPGAETSGHSFVRPDANNLAILVDSATLQYPIGQITQGSLKTNLFRMLGHKDRAPRPQYVDAIKSMNLNISNGERVGLIGRNGSGKSTLLRALAGIYPLKEGQIRVVGQIGTLLDIWLGFEPESTGRENIYHRGMAMGFSPKQLRAVEKDIIDFAGLEEFIDLPVRTYSQGMFVRLGFAISTQIAPDVLLIDEVFGAGDADFSKRAVERMYAIVARAGIMVIATHDAHLITQICTRVLWMHKGQIIRDGPPQVVVPQYEKFNRGELVI